MKKLKKKSLIMLIVSIIMIMNISIFAYELTYSEDFYDSISWIWEYSGEADPSYNCLAYAIGSSVWEWGSSWGATATEKQVDTFLEDKGYSTSGKWPYIISYGQSSDEIAHFSKVTGEVWCRAKWGELEKFNHGDHDPYYSDSIYGSKRKYYYQ